MAPRTTATLSMDELLTHATWIRGLARSLVRDDASADDLVQDVWTKALDANPDDRDSARPWLATVLRNAWTDRHRSRSRRSAREARVARAEAVPSTVEVVARAELHRRVVEAVMALEPPYRETVLLRWFEELPPRVVAERMGVPVETVRTRSRRALERLRAALDAQSDGNRDAWRAALLPIALGPSGAETSTTGGRSMWTKTILITGVMLLAAYPAAQLFAPADPGGDEAPDGEPAAEVALAPDDDAGELAPDDERRERGARREREEVEGIDDDPSGLRVSGEVGDADRKASPWDEPAEVFANGALSIRVALDPEAPVADQPFHVVTTFENTGTGPVRFHVPEFTGSLPYPQIVFRNDAGETFGISPPSFQSMWTTGLQGTIVRLEPGEKHDVRSRVDSLVPVDPDDPDFASSLSRSQIRHELKPGRYTLSARLLKPDDTVPWGEPNFRAEKRSLPGLWTGDVRAEPIAIHVAVPDEPRVLVTLPEEVVVGGGAVIRVVFENPGTEPRTLEGPFALRRATKGGPSVAAYFEPTDDGAQPSAANPDARLTLEAGGRREFELNVDRLEWTVQSRRKSGITSLTWPMVREYGMTWVTTGNTHLEGANTTSSDAKVLVWQQATDLSAAGVRLAVDATRLFEAAPTLTLRLRNESQETLQLPGDLLSDLAFTVRGPRRLPSPRLAADASFSSGTIEIRPGELWTHEFAVEEGWLPPNARAGTYSLQAHWANADPGADAGLTLGRLTSEPVQFDLP